MPRSAPDCPDCRVAMFEGIILDITHGGVQQSKWVHGPIEKSFWTGMKLRGKERLPVATFRCPRCGLLKSYAHPE